MESISLQDCQQVESYGVHLSSKLSTGRVRWSQSHFKFINSLGSVEYSPSHYEDCQPVESELISLYDFQEVVR